MSDPVQALLVLAGMCFAAMAIGGSFVFGVATVCRWMQWAPVNTRIEIQYHDPASRLPSNKLGGE